jgi:hypothetical protein
VIDALALGVSTSLDTAPQRNAVPPPLPQRGTWKRRCRPAVIYCLAIAMVGLATLLGARTPFHCSGLRPPAVVPSPLALASSLGGLLPSRRSRLTKRVIVRSPDLSKAPVRVRQPPSNLASSATFPRSCFTREDHPKLRRESHALPVNRECEVRGLNSEVANASEASQAHPSPETRVSKRRCECQRTRSVDWNHGVCGSARCSVF